MSIFEKIRKLPGITKGAIGAMGFLGAAPNIIPYNVLEIVSLVHAVIIGWNELMAAMWRLISGVLGLPELPPELISATVLGFSLSSTWAYSIYVSERGQHLGFIQNAAFGSRIIMAFFDGPLLLMIGGATYPSLWFWSAMALLFSILLASLIRLPKLRMGFLTILGFLGFLEIVYLVSTDQARDAFDTFVCERQSAGLPKCSGA